MPPTNPPVTPEPTTPPPTPEPTNMPTSLPVVGDVSAVVCTGETTVIFGILDDATPGLPMPNSLSLTSIVLQGAPARRALQETGGLKSIDGARCELGYAAG